MGRKAVRAICYRQTSRVVVVHDANRTLGTGTGISAIIAEEAFDCLDAPIARVTAPDIPAIPASPSPGAVLYAIGGEDRRRPGTDIGVLKATDGGVGHTAVDRRFHSQVRHCEPISK